MTIEKLMELRTSNEAPYDHESYTVWLHNKIIEDVRYELLNFRERKSINIKSSYAACNHILSLPSLKILE